MSLNSKIFLGSLFLFLLISCNKGTHTEADPNTDQKKESVAVEEKQPVKKFIGQKVPVLCYHAIRDLGSDASSEQKAYSVSPANFEAQMKILADNGYTSITPDELHDFYTSAKPLPEKPVMITFDDGRKDQHSIGAKILDQYNLKGVFFIMTVSLGRSVFMSRNDVKDLSDRGHIIGCHTWDHHKVTKYQKEDYQLQLAKPKKQLEKITGKPVTSFAYPFGLWNRTAADSLKSNGYTTAFIFYGKQDKDIPLYTIERINIPYSMKTGNFLGKIEKAE